MAKRKASKKVVKKTAKRPTRGTGKTKSTKKSSKKSTKKSPKKSVKKPKVAAAKQLADNAHPRAPQVLLLGERYDRLPFKPDDPDWLCIDCEAALGELHELGCDTEDCPRCGGQLIGCGCLPSPD